MKSSYELAMERLEKAAPTKKLTDDQKSRIAELETIYRAKLAERETFLNSEIAKETARGDRTAAENLKDHLAREKRRINGDWEEKKALIHREGGVTLWKVDLEAAKRSCGTYSPF